MNERQMHVAAIAIVAFGILSLFLLDADSKKQAKKPAKYEYVCIDKEKRIESSFTINPLDEGTRTEYYVIFEDSTEKVYVEKMSQKQFYTYKIGKAYKFKEPL